MHLIKDSKEDLHQRQLFGGARPNSNVIDTTTIDLYVPLYVSQVAAITKFAIKLHTLLNFRYSISSFVHISNGKVHEVNVLDILIPECRQLLHYGPGLHRFHPVVCLVPASSLFHHPRQIQSRQSPCLFELSGQNHRIALRTDGCIGHIL